MNGPGLLEVEKREVHLWSATQLAVHFTYTTLYHTFSLTSMVGIVIGLILG